MKKIIVTLLMSALTTGCMVSKETLVATQLELESCNGSVSQCTTELEQCAKNGKELKGEHDSAVAKAAKLERELEDGQKAAAKNLEALEAAKKDLSATTVKLDKAKATEAAAKKDLDRLAAREAELRKKLQSELDNCTVEIDRLKKSLAVRVLDKLMFKPASDEMLPGGKAILDKVAEAVKDDDANIRVEGHTDDLPISAKLKERWFSNWELSSARAGAVVRYLQWGHGIDPTRLETAGMGSYRPIAPNDTEKNRKLNRRVEIILTQPR